MATNYLKKILSARVYDVARETELQLAAELTKRLGNQVLLKREDNQPVFSFKLRGAYNKMAHLSSEALKRGGHCSFRRQPCSGRSAFSSQNEMQSRHRDAPHHA